MNQRLVHRIDAIAKAVKARNTQDLKRIGTDSIEEASTSNDKDLAGISVIAYSLYKILSKDHFVKNKRWPAVSGSIASSLGKAQEAIGNGQQEKFAKSLAGVIHEIEAIDMELSHFARNIFGKAKVKQASTAYAAGLSLSQAAELTGADKKDLQMYIGTTRIHDEQPVHEGIAKRLRKLRESLK